MPPIYHITSRAEWDAALLSGSYRAPSLDKEGFIHCSTAQQIVPVANNFYRGQSDLLLLCIDPDQLAAEVRFEPPINPQTGQPEPDKPDLFPHLYGAVNIGAVVDVIPFPPNADGTFALPDGIA
ncbi:MAG: DUF952 domain-containing protein [Anaerolineaceae bacterium]|nr:DUF952 domain-containing protein [Anaerolineaceae bacterium]